LDIVKERLFREFDIDVIMTSPQVTYRIRMAGDKTSEYSRFSPTLTPSPSPSPVGERVADTTNKVFTYIYVSNPEDLPDREKYISIEEPIAKVEIITPTPYV
jgi:translation elongation factor EF-4